MKIATTTSLTLIPKHNECAQKFINGFAMWLQNDYEAVKYFKSVSIIGKRVYFELYDDRRIGFEVGSILTLNPLTFSCNLLKWELYVHNGGYVDRQWVYFGVNVNIKLIFVDLNGDGMINIDGYISQNNYDAIIDKMIEVLPPTY